MGGCSAPSDPLELPTCSDSPKELARLDIPPPDPSSGDQIRVYDLGDGVVVKHHDFAQGDPTADQGARFWLIDSCGTTNVELSGTTTDLVTGAANVGGEVVFCGQDASNPSGGLWEVLADGSRGEELAVGKHCKARVLFPDRPPSFGVVFDRPTPTGRTVTQHLPDGDERVISEGESFDLVTTTSGATVFTYGENAAIHPGDGSASIQLDLPEPVHAVYTQLGGPHASDWVIAETRPARSGEETPAPGYAVNLRTGAWFPTPPVALDLPDQAYTFSLRDGLLATNGDMGVFLSREGWEEHLSIGYWNVTVLDAQRVFLVGDDVRIIAAPLEYPDAAFEPEVLWSRPRGTEEPTPRGAGVAYGGVVLLNVGDVFSAHAELWAYPLDGSPAYPFLPASPTHLYFGREYVTGIGFYPEDSGRLWLYRRRVGGEFEVIADRLRSGVSYGQYLEHPWTPELGRILYAVEDGDAVSIRQHRLED